MDPHPPTNTHTLSNTLSLSLSLSQTYIGTVVVSVNPYKQVGIYDKATMETYRGINFYEEPPHMYVFTGIRQFHVYNNNTLVLYIINQFV